MKRFRSKTIRVFVSSTFEDMKAERDALQRHVFPELQRQCRQKGWQLQAIDLRWGISEEAGADQRTMRICLREIARCQEQSPRPNFLILLGDRYGWRPLPEVIPHTEYGQFIDVMSDETKAAFTQWYREDRNACPEPEWVLQPRTGGYRNDYNRYAREVERPLGDFFRRFASSLAPGDPIRIKYERSATEQEIHAGALNISSAHEHVIAVNRTLVRPIDPEHASTYLNVEDDGRPDTEAEMLLNQLKEQIAATLPGENQIERTVTLEKGALPSDYLDELCRAVRDRLGQIIEDEIERFNMRTSLETERELHDSFARERTVGFRGREDECSILQTYIADGTPTPMVLHGESGTGKSALMAHVALCTPDQHPGAHLIARFIGATAASSNTPGLLLSICEDIRDAYPYDDDPPLPSDFYDLVDAFQDCLHRATPTHPIIIFLDAIDQLPESDPAADVAWLPEQLPENVRLVLSTLPGSTLDALSARRSAPVALCDLAGLPEHDAESALKQWLAQTNRGLTPPQLAEILTKFTESGQSPLYLRLAFEEAKHWPSYAHVPALPASVSGLINHLFDRLSQDTEHGPLIVRKALTFLRCARRGLTDDEMLGLLGMDGEYCDHFFKTSLHHLAGHEEDFDAARERSAIKRFKRWIDDLNSVPEQKERPIPPVLWIRLFHDLENYLGRRDAPGGEVLAFFHRHFGESVDQRWLTDDKAHKKARKAIHGHMHAYFESRDWFEESIEEQRRRAATLPPTPRPVNKRKCDELPHHVERYNQIQFSETSFVCIGAPILQVDYLEAKVEAGMLRELIAEMDAVLSDRRGLPFRYRRRARGVVKTLRRHADFLERHPTTLLQCLWNTLWWFDCPDVTRHYRNPKSVIAGSPDYHKWLEEWVEKKRDQFPGFTWFRALRPPQSHITAGEWTIFRAARGTTLHAAIAPDGDIVASAGTDSNTVAIYDVDTGKRGPELRGLSPYEKITRLFFSRTGKYVVAVAETNGQAVLCIWSIQTRAVVLKREVDAQRISPSAFDEVDYLLAVTHHDRLYLYVLQDHTAQIVDIEDTQFFIRHAQFFPESLLMLLIDDHMHIFDLEKDTVQLTIESTFGPVREVHVAESEEFLISFHEEAGIPLHQEDSGSGSHALAVWDLSTGQAIATTRFDSPFVERCLFSQGGTLAAVVCPAEHITLYETTKLLKLGSIPAPTRGAPIALSSDGCRLATASGADVLLWDTISGRKLLQLAAHNTDITDLAFGHDDDLLLTASAHDGTVRVWPTTTKVHPALIGHDAPLRVVTYALEAQSLLTGDAEGRVHIWDPITNVKRCRLPDRDSPVAAAALSRDGQRAVVAYGDGTFIVFACCEGTEIARIQSTHEDIRGVTFDATNERVMFLSSDAVGVWPIASDTAPATLNVDTGFAQDVLDHLPEGHELHRVESLACSLTSRYFMLTWSTNLGPLVACWALDADELACVAGSEGVLYEADDFDLREIEALHQSKYICQGTGDAFAIIDLEREEVVTWAPPELDYAIPTAAQNDLFAGFNQHYHCVYTVEDGPHFKVPLSGEAPSVRRTVTVSWEHFQAFISEFFLEVLPKSSHGRTLWFIIIVVAVAPVVTTVAILIALVRTGILSGVVACAIGGALAALYGQSPIRRVLAKLHSEVGLTVDCIRCGKPAILYSTDKHGFRCPHCNLERNIAPNPATIDWYEP
jgi:WD40 repeat protein